MTDTVDNGKPLREAEEMWMMRFTASVITRDSSKAPYGGVYDVNAGFGKMHSYTVHEPVGVCAEITPWNYPLLMGVWKWRPLAAGNSIVMKPSSKAPLSTIKLLKYLKGRIPAGAANLVLGGGEVGAFWGEP